MIRESNINGWQRIPKSNTAGKVKMINIRDLGFQLEKRGRSGRLSGKSNKVTDVKMWQRLLIRFDKEHNIIDLIDTHKGKMCKSNNLLCILYAIKSRNGCCREGKKRKEHKHACKEEHSAHLADCWSRV